MFPLVLESIGFSPSGNVILKNINLRIEAGSFTVILGPNGAGKSVLMRLMHGLLTPSHGTLHWGDAPARPQAQAMLFQRPVMLRRSVLGNVMYGLQIQGVPLPDAKQRALAALESVGLLQLADRPARILSGGEQQRVALARAAALKPRILFLDEPTASLDPSAMRAIEAGIAALHAAGTTIVMVTHHLGQARRLGQNIVFLANGCIKETTPAHTFFKQPQSQAAADFLKEELP
ncbi:MAG TPA: ATP-binding cassette domain-containing protein [Rhodocyclaceae bacterium]|nr:ATP-binding cassette domain-containing protein [Rhodocyclaceae bacterium]